VQLQYINELLTERIDLASKYTKALEGMAGVTLPVTTIGGRHSYQTFCVFVENRDRILRDLRKQGIEVQFGTYSLHLQPAFQNPHICVLKGSMSGSKYAFEHCLALPLYHGLEITDQRYVVHKLLESMSRG